MGGFPPPEKNPKRKKKTNFTKFKKIINYIFFKKLANIFKIFSHAPVPLGGFFL